MAATAAPAPVRGSWRRLAIGLAAFLFAPFVPALRAAMPIEQTPMLVVVIVAVCALVAWRNGGRFVLALLWVGVAAFVLISPAGPPDSPYNWLARGWTLLLAACFGLVSVIASTENFFPRALSALAVATALAFALVLVSPGGPARISNAMTSEFNRRNDQSIASLREVSGQSGWKELVNGSPTLQRLTEESEAQLASIPKWSSMLVPALLALESLAAMGLGWALFHRMSNVAIGPRLGKLRDFRFNDQLVWGVAVGASIFLLPAFEEGRNAGLNLLLFFGILYTLRGMGILAWMSRTRLVTFMLIGLALVAWPLVAALAFGIGLGDTWLDLRTRAQAKSL
jgi:pimeloyl-ACP methyl ester carboxylesterase